MKKNIKRFALTLAMAGALAAALTGCGKDSGKADSGNPSSGSESGTNSASNGYSFTYNGTVIALNADMADVKAAIGEPVDYFESDSCAFQGKDKTYTYSSFVIKTYPDGDKDYVLSITLKDDTVATPEGISIGSDRQAVIDAYGEGEDTGSSLIYTKDSTTLTFLLDGNKVTQIDYTAVK